jgi:hypothetical protein
VLGYAVWLFHRHMFLVLPMAVATFFIFLQIAIWAEPYLKAPQAEHETHIQRGLNRKR